MNKRVLLAGGLAALLLGGAAGGYLWQRAERRAELFAAALPPVPDLSPWPAAFRQRLQAAEQRLATEPVAALAELSRLYHANGFFAEAAQCYGGLEQLEPHEPRWPHLHATILAGYGDNRPALALWRRTVELAPDYVPARLRLGDVYLKLSDLPAAARTYREVLARDPREPYAQLGLARCEFEAERWDSARQLLEPLVAQTNFVLGYDLIATVYERLGQEDRARDIRARSRASGAFRDPADPWSDALGDDCYDVYRLSLASGAADRNGDNALAFRRLEQALALAPDQATLYFQLGGLYRANKSYTKARQNFERCTQLKPDFSDGWAHLALMLETLGDRAAADRALEQGLRHCPNSPGLHLQNAQRLVRAGRGEEAIPEFRTSIRLRPNEADAYLGLATVLITLGQRDEGIAELDRALVAEPEHPAALCIRAFDAIVSGDTVAAGHWIRRALNQPRSRPQDLDQLRAAYREKFGRDFR